MLFQLSKKRKESANKGFALLAALLATMLIMALGALALMLSGRDILISNRIAIEKRTISAAETGVHQLMSGFDPSNLAAASVSNAQADPANANYTYSISTPSRPTTGPEMVPLSGYSIGGGQSWGQTRYVTTVTGQDSATGNSVQIDIGMGYGPVEFSTMSR